MKVTLNSIQVTFFPFGISQLFVLAVIFILLFLSALMSASEVAYFSLGPSNINILKKKSSKSSRLILKLLEEPKHLLGAILIANNFVNIGIVILSTYLTNSMVDFSSVPTLGFIFQVVIITFIILMIGEIIPKVYSTYNPVKFATLMAYPMKLIIKVESPLIYLLIKSTSIVDNKMQKRNQISMDDLSNALELTSDSLTEEKEILKGIVELGNTEVNDILTSRVDVVSIEIKTSFKKVLQIIQDSGYSRIPVFAVTFDDIKGILYIKDLLPHLHKPDFRWQSVIRPPYFIPEKKKINDLLQEFQTTKIHMAIVVDEYGGTKGIVTLEDILEQIVGEISDEFDEDEIFYSKIDKNTFYFKGKTLLHDFYKITNTESANFEEARGEADTLAGFILELKGEIPALHEQIIFKNYTFKIEEADNRRIKKIKVIIVPNK